MLFILIILDIFQILEAERKEHKPATNLEVA